MPTGIIPYNKDLVWTQRYSEEGGPYWVNQYGVSTYSNPNITPIPPTVQAPIVNEYDRNTTLYSTPVDTSLRANSLPMGAIPIINAFDTFSSPVASPTQGANTWIHYYDDEGYDWWRNPLTGESREYDPTPKTHAPYTPPQSITLPGTTGIIDRALTPPTTTTTTVTPPAAQTDFSRYLATPWSTNESGTSIDQFGNPLTGLAAYNPQGYNSYEEAQRAGYYPGVVNIGNRGYIWDNNQLSPITPDPGSTGKTVFNIIEGILSAVNPAMAVAVGASKAAKGGYEGDTGSLIAGLLTAIGGAYGVGGGEAGGIGSSTGLTAQEMVNAGATAQDMAKYGYSAAQIAQATGTAIDTAQALVQTAKTAGVAAGKAALASYVSTGKLDQALAAGLAAGLTSGTISFINNGQFLNNSDNTLIDMNNPEDIWEATQNTFGDNYDDVVGTLSAEEIKVLLENQYGLTQTQFDQLDLDTEGLRNDIASGLAQTNQTLDFMAEQLGTTKDQLGSRIAELNLSQDELSRMMDSMGVKLGETQTNLANQLGLTQTQLLDLQESTNLGLNALTNRITSGDQNILSRIESLKTAFDTELDTRMETLSNQQRDYLTQLEERFNKNLAEGNATSLAVFENEMKGLGDQLGLTQQELDALQPWMQDIEAGMEASTKSLQSIAESLGTDIKGLSDKIAELGYDDTDLTNMLEGMKTNLSAADTELAKSLGLTQQQIQTLNDQTKGWVTDIQEGMRQTNTTLDAFAKSVGMDVAGLKAGLSSLGLSDQELASRIDTLKGQLGSDLATSTQELARQIAESESATNATMQGIADALGTDIAGLGDKIAELGYSDKDLKSMLEAMKGNLSSADTSLATELGLTQQQIQDLNEQTQGWMEDIRRGQAATDASLKSIADQLGVSVSELGGQISELGLSDTELKEMLNAMGVKLGDTDIALANQLGMTMEQLLEMERNTKGWMTDIDTGLAQTNTSLQNLATRLGVSVNDLQSGLDSLGLNQQQMDEYLKNMNAGLTQADLDLGGRLDEGLEDLGGRITDLGTQNNTAYTSLLKGLLGIFGSQQQTKQQGAFSEAFKQVMGNPSLQAGTKTSILSPQMKAMAYNPYTPKLPWEADGGQSKGFAPIPLQALVERALTPPPPQQQALSRAQAQVDPYTAIINAMMAQ